jgi:hypothetical protein
VILIAFTCIAYADRNVPAEPEIQGLGTSTGMNVQGTITETDSGTWTTTNDPLSGTYITFVAGSPVAGLLVDPSTQLANAGGSVTGYWSWGVFWIDTITIPTSLLNQPINGLGLTFQGLANTLATGGYSSQTNTYTGGLHTGVLDPGQVQYTTGYNDQIMAVSGQSTFAKTMAVSTGNKIADQSNIKADTSLQYIAIDTGRATRTEDLLLDGAAQATNTSDAILCPFASSVSSVIPAYCNIEQAGSSIDTSLTSVVTHADDRFVGTDSTFPVVLNYNINAQGITLSDGTSSPMIGSVSAYLKVHVQEARNVTPGPILTDLFEHSFTTGNGNPVKSEDLAYSETSSASGLVSHFSKSMSYQSGFNLI